MTRFIFKKWILGVRVFISLICITPVLVIFQNCSGDFKTNSSESASTNSNPDLTPAAAAADFLQPLATEGNFRPFNVKEFLTDTYLGGAIQTASGKVFVFNNERMPTPKEIPELFGSRGLAATYNTAACGITSNTEVTCYSIPQVNGQPGGSSVAPAGVTKFAIANALKISVDNVLCAYLSNGDFGCWNYQTQVFEKIGNFPNVVDFFISKTLESNEAWLLTGTGEIYYMGPSATSIVPGVPTAATTPTRVPNLPNAKKMKPGLIYVGQNTYQSAIALFGKDGIVFEKNFVTNTSRNINSVAYKDAWLFSPQGPICHQKMDDVVYCQSYSSYPTIVEYQIGYYPNVKAVYGDHILLLDGQLLTLRRSNFGSKLPVTGNTSQVTNSQIQSRLSNIKTVNKGSAAPAPYFGKTYCGISDDSKVYCWGDNSGGQFGHRNFQYTDTPQPIAGIAQVKDLFIVGAYGNALCAQHLSFEVTCWFGTTNLPFKIRNSADSANVQIKFLYMDGSSIVAILTSGEKGILLASLDPTALIVLGYRVQLDTNIAVHPSENYISASDQTCFLTASTTVPNTFCAFNGAFGTPLAVPVFTKKAMGAGITLADSNLTICYLAQNNTLSCERVSLTGQALSSVDLLQNVKDFHASRGQLCALTMANEVYCIGINASYSINLTPQSIITAMTKATYPALGTVTGLLVTGDSLYLWSASQVYRSGLDGFPECSNVSPCRVGLPRFE